ncbi:MAG: pyridoxal 5'-phosphate synthase glutaminase subunit PdxT [Methanothermobacter sp.]|nr:pyridoxal 5'-phosphate synthase glutaminase subunit PdxT [Methanothermobacter sp.]
MIKIGILNLQGDVSEHLEMTKKAIKKLKIEAEAIKVKKKDEIRSCDALIISGGESTVIGKLMEKENIIETIKKEKIPIMGTCAGMILLAKETDHKQPLLNIIDMKVQRNAFGRQKESFEEKIKILGKEFNGIFIRAPAVTKTGPGVKILSKLNDKIIAVQQGKNIALAFHPELGNDTLLHEHFIKEVL